MVVRILICTQKSTAGAGRGSPRTETEASPAQPLTQAGGVRGCWLAQGPDPGEMGGASAWPKGESPFPQSLERGRRSSVFTAEEAGVALGRDLWSKCPSQ